MKTTDKTAPTTEETTLTSIDTTSLDDVTGGCAACGQTCANGPAPAATGGSKLSKAFAAFNAFARR